MCHTELTFSIQALKNKPLLTEKKKMHNLKAENYVLFSEYTEDLSRETASQRALRDYSKEIKEEPG